MRIRITPMTSLVIISGISVVVVTTLSLTPTLSVLATQSALLLPIQTNLLTYQNPSYGIKILYPSGWQVEEGDKIPGDYVTNIVTFEPPNQENHYAKKFYCGDTCFAVLVDNSITTQNVNLAKILDDVINQLKQGVAGATFVKTVEYTTVNNYLGGSNHPAYKLVYIQKQGSTKYQKMLIGTVIDNQIYTFYYKSKVKLYPTYLPTAQRMIDSFQFTN